MSESLRLFIVAGEPSGDRIAADLVKRLRTRTALTLSGVGGDELIGQGLRSLYPMSDLAVMGVTDVLLNLPRLLWRLEQTARAILEQDPDIVVLVDAQDFSRILAQRLRKRGFRKPIVLYVAPSVWARHPERAARLKPLFDAVLAVLPFEPAVMQKLGGPPTWYVGHPALAERIEQTHTVQRGAVVLLPGSRTGELKRHLPLLKQVAPQLLQNAAVTELVLPTLPRLRPVLEAETPSWPVPVRIVDNRDQRQDIYASAIAALCVSGTVTLELALSNVPMTVIYALDRHQARMFDKLGRPYVSLPNIILGRPVVTEIVAANLEPTEIASSITTLIGNEKARQAQITAFGELAKLIDMGEPPHGREDPADRILRILGDQREPIGS